MAATGAAVVPAGHCGTHLSPAAADQPRGGCRVSGRSAITTSVNDETRELWWLRWIDVVKFGAAAEGTTSAS
jgi:hypothetical protein